MLSKLSKENYDKLNENLLYKLEPKRNTEESYIGCIPMSYWCRNWTFRVQKGNDHAIMCDTYWTTQGNYIEVTDQNISEFEVIFDMNEVKMISKESSDEYDTEDVFCVAIDSGGITYPKYFVKKNANKSRAKQIEKKEEEIRKLKHKLEWAERELKELTEM